MNNTLYPKIKADFFGGLLEFIQKYWKKLLPSTILFLALMLLVCGYPFFLYLSKLMPEFANYLAEVGDGGQPDLEALIDILEKSALKEKQMSDIVSVIFILTVGNWFRLSWYKMNKDIILKGNLQKGESYLGGVEIPLYIKSFVFSVSWGLINFLLMFGVRLTIPVMELPVNLLVYLVDMQLLLVVPYIYFERLSIFEAVKKSMATIPPMSALRYTAVAFIILIAAVVCVFVLILTIPSLLLLISPMLAGIGLCIIYVTLLFIFMFVVISLPSVLYYHHTDTSTKDYESSPYDSFG